MDYQLLRAQAQALGLLERSGWNYAPLLLLVSVIGGLALGLVLWLPDGWRWAAVPALVLFWIQVGLVGHDAGHLQIFRGEAANRWLGRLCMPLLLGMSHRAWVNHHNRHHVYPNVMGVDPDIEHDLLAYTPQAARSRQGVGKWTARYQAWLYPLLSFGATVGFRLDAWRYALGRGADQTLGRAGGRAERRLELLLLVVNLGLWLVPLSLVLGPERWLPIFVVAQLLLGFHMAMVFAPNHKGMSLFTPDERPPFLILQLLSSRNVHGGWLVDFLYGGLNYQIEHHLFPTMPRRHFAACAALVQRYCADHALPYASRGILQSYVDTLRSLNSLGRQAGVVLPS